MCHSGQLLGEDAELAVPKSKKPSPIRGDYRGVY
jgi:hypothetical protein